MKNFTKSEELITYYELYGALLTIKQQQYFDLYFYNDYSLSEIADKFNISRSAIYDSLLRIEERLIYFEKNLKIMKKILLRREYINDYYDNKLSINKLLNKILLIDEESEGDE